MGELNTMSINFLDPEKCKFYLNPNGFAALKTEDKDYRRVRLLRTLPLHRPFEYISVSDMDKNEIGIIKNAADFPSESREIIEKDLRRKRYQPQCQNARFGFRYVQRLRRQPIHYSRYQCPQAENAQEDRAVLVLSLPKF